MAQMFPSRPDADAPPSEVKVFWALKRGLPGEVLVLHGRRLFLPGDSRRRPREGEADFVIIHPMQGCLVLEVKGGGVGRDKQGWYSIDRHRSKNRIKDPGKQAQQTMHSLVKYFNGHAGGTGSGYWVWGVSLPDIDVKADLDPALPRALVLDRGGLDHPEAVVRGMFASHGFADTPMAEGLPREILNVIAPTLELVPSLSNRLREETPALVRLTEEQMDVLDLLQGMNRVVVDGVAGTGKTLIAMEKAKRLSASDKRVLFLCYNAPLADYLAARAHGFQVCTFHKFCKDMAKGSGQTFAPRDKPGFWDTDAPEILEKALDLLPDERFDAVIVDEGQDFKELWWLVIEKLLADQEDGVLYVFQDPKQDIYGGGSLEALHLQRGNLKYNCRNTRKIAQYSAQFVGAEAQTRPGAPDGTDVEVHSCRNSDESVDRVRTLLHRFAVEEALPTRNIVVLTTGSAEASPVWKARTFGNYRLVDLNMGAGPGEIRFASLHRFKGLEADVVILCDVSPSLEAQYPKHLYVASSRARLLLAVVRTEEA